MAGREEGVSPMSVQQVRFTLEEHAKVRAAAQSWGETTGVFVRDAALMRADQPTPDSPLMADCPCGHVDERHYAARVTAPVRQPLGTWGCHACEAEMGKTLEACREHLEEIIA